MEALAAGFVSALVVVGLVGVVVGRELAGSGSDDAAEVNAFVATQPNVRIVAPGGVFTEIMRLELPPGAYQVFGEISLHNRDSGASLSAQCALVPSNEDGTSPPLGAPGQDVGFLHLARAGEPGDQGELSLSVSQELSRSGAVVLTCAGYGSDEDAFAHNGVIRAIEVGSITTAPTTTTESPTDETAPAPLPPLPG